VPVGTSPSGSPVSPPLSRLSRLSAHFGRSAIGGTRTTCAIDDYITVFQHCPTIGIVVVVYYDNAAVFRILYRGVHLVYLGMAPVLLVLT
jgi:hypothetical protein